MTDALSRRGFARLAASAALAAVAVGAVPGLVGCAAAAVPTIPPARPGPGHVIPRLPGRTMSMAWTVDDGVDVATLRAYLGMMQETGTPITFCPTHRFARSWEQCADELGALIGTGQAQLVNHTWTHRTLTALADADVRDEITRNEDWIQATFGITTRPYLRPPAGGWDDRVLRLAGELGFTSLLLWDSSLRDSAPISAAQLMANADRAFFPGAVMLGHANALEVTRHFTELHDLIAARHLKPVTIDDAFGTDRATG